MSLFRLSAKLGLIAACVALCGCVSLFPKAKPSQLYRFGAPEAAAAAPVLPPPGARVIAQGPLAFPDDAAGDRLLTVTGDEAAYIADARWVSPAPVLFDEALVRAFEAAGGPRLVPSAAAARPSLILSLAVQTFETRYDQGPTAPPQVVVELRAQLIRPEDRSVVSDQLLTSAKRASDNRVGPIVQAYDEAVAEVLTKLTASVAQAG